jgi:hypothetical protein
MRLKMLSARLTTMHSIELHAMSMFRRVVMQVRVRKRTIDYVTLKHHVSIY